MFKIFVIGIAESVLSTRQKKLLAGCVLIVGARRFAAMTDKIPVEFHDIAPLPQALAEIASHLQQGNVAVLASGDPLFYGIGRRLLADFPAEQIEILPALSSVQQACALFRIPWDDAFVASLHGRTAAHLPGLLLGHAKTIVLTDAKHSPERIARLLLDYLQSVGETKLVQTIRMMVAEDLGLANETTFCGTLEEGATRHFTPLNIVCLLVPAATALPHYRFGLSEDQLHHSRGLITKDEVRAATLHQLRLPETGVFWDIGAGSGSLSIEAARANPKLTVFAIERKDEELENIKNNIVKFRSFNIVPVPGRAPEVLEGLPAPDRIFIGGSSGSLPAIIEMAADRLAARGVLVVNGVTDRTVQEAPPLLAKHGFIVSRSVIGVTRTESDGTEKIFNPITILTGRR
jgi:precorrin-6Y C5,15-methyltransferase (decarboxylating)